jgi:hypothetical protein
MISIVSFITLAVVGMVVATPLKRAPAVSLSGRDSDPAEDKNVVDCTDSTQIPFIVDAWVTFALKYPHHRYLTVDRHTEALALANGAVAYINANGVTDELFVTYFGAVQDATQQLRVFSVCPGQSDSGGFLIHSNLGRGRWSLNYPVLHRP